MRKRLPYTFQENLGYGGKKINEDKALRILQRVGINAISDLEETPLMISAYLGNTNLLKKVIEEFKKIKPNNAEIFGIALLSACSHRQLECIQILVEEGANIEHLNKYNNTPLSNIFINTFSDPIPSAKYLISKGSEITERVLKMGMSWDSEKFTELLDSLDIEFDRNLIPKKEIIIEEKIDTNINIIELHNTTNKKDYNKTAKVIWQKLVPKSGQADTVQGELLRAIEKLRDEAHRNGNGNFHKDCHGLLVKYLKKYLIDESIFGKEMALEIKKGLKEISYKTIPYTDDDIYDNINERIVDWYLQNPKQVKHIKNDTLYC